MTEIKDLIKQFSALSPGEEKADLAIKIGAVFLNSDLANAEKYLQEGFEVSLEAGYTWGTARCHAVMGNLKMRQRAFESAIEHHTRAFELAKNLNEKNLMAQQLDGIAVVHFTQENYSKSLEYGLQAVALFQESKTKDGQYAICLNNLGNAYERLGQINQSEGYYLESLDILEKLGLFEKATNVRGNLAVLLALNGEYPKALQHFERCHQDFIKHNHKPGIMNSLNNIATIHFKMENYTLAMEAFLKLLRLSDTFEHPRLKTKGYHGLGKIFLTFGGFEKSLENLNKAEEYCDENNPATLVNIYFDKIILFVKHTMKPEMEVTLAKTWALIEKYELKVEKEELIKLCNAYSIPLPTRSVNS